ncbi:MAG: methionyl-tRNA formyltransferase [Gallionellaceae bacterium]|nr:methionyl-tRNA formyltransferase [Gallionellaceae bacterium]
MKIIFAGTPAFAAHALKALLDKQFEIVAVLTQPDRPSGRGMQLKPSPVKQLALEQGLAVLQPKTLKDTDIQNQLINFKADLMIVAAYGLILPKVVLQIPRLGCWNIHASLLPRWRGAAPIQRAILAGDQQTGITIMQMDAGLDTGDMLFKKESLITTSDTSETLHDKLAVLGANAILEALTLHQENKILAIPQDGALASYASKLSKEESQIDWSKSAQEVALNVRGYNPFPGATSVLNGTPLKIWQASVCDGPAGLSGEVLQGEKNALIVACGVGALSLEIIQKPNAKALPATQFLQGFTVKAGDRFVTR